MTWDTACRRKTLGALGIVATVTLILYLLSWPVFSLFWYATTIEETVTQSEHPVVNGVEVHVWCNPTATSIQRSALLPMLRRVECRGPHSLGVRFVDPGFAAVRARVHEAWLETPDGARIPLILVNARGAEPDQWLPFFKNATQFIVHTFHEETFELTDHFVVRIDLSIVNREQTERQTVAIPLHVHETVDRRWEPLTD